MKRILFTFFLTAFPVAFLAAFDASKFEKLEIEQVKATPEEYRNKKIFIETVFLRYETTFPPYMDRSGFKAGKHYYIKVKPANFPVMADKDDMTNAIIPSLKAGAKIYVYGKIKKFRSPPHDTTLPLYYLEFEHIEVIEMGDGKVDGEKDGRPGPLRPIRKRPLKNAN